MGSGLRRRGNLSPLQLGDAEGLQGVYSRFAILGEPLEEADGDCGFGEIGDEEAVFLEGLEAFLDFDGL